MTAIKSLIKKVSDPFLVKTFPHMSLHLQDSSSKVAFIFHRYILTFQKIPADPDIIFKFGGTRHKHPVFLGIQSYKALKRWCVLKCRGYADHP